MVLLREQESVVVPDVNDISKWLGSKGEGLEFQAENRATARFVPFYHLRVRSSYCRYFDLEST